MVVLEYNKGDADMDTDKIKQEIEIPKGHLSKHDILNELEKDDGLKIYPFSNQYLKAASYDLTPTIIAMSSRTGMLETIYREEHYKKDAYYIYVHPKDTVLIVSNEFIIFPPNIAGYISSRVSKVVEGFGHISTTIDPNWSGAVLIAVSNPSNQLLKIYVGKAEETVDETVENVSDKFPNQLATVTFHYLNTLCSTDDKENKHKGMRIDLLEKISYQHKKGVRALFRKLFFNRRRAFTDYFFAACKAMEGQFSPTKWDDFLKDFSSLTLELPGKNELDSVKSQKKASSYIITENFIIRFCHWFIRYKHPIYLIIVFLSLLLLWVNMSPEEFSTFIIQKVQDILTNIF